MQYTEGCVLGQPLPWCPIKMRVLHQNKAVFLAPILPRVMKEGESKKAIAHFDKTVNTLIMIGHYGTKALSFNA